MLVNPPVIIARLQFESVDQVEHKNRYRPGDPDQDEHQGFQDLSMTSYLDWVYLCFHEYELLNYRSVDSVTIFCYYTVHVRKKAVEA